jgi:hypothetical protein
VVRGSMSRARSTPLTTSLMLTLPTPWIVIQPALPG